MPRIFISYRRADATDAAGRIFDRLVAVFGEQHVFKDVDSIPLGSDFGQVIAERLKDCDVVIVVIGRFWLNVKSRDGTPRLENPGDYVRIEIEQALDSRALVAPVLVGNAAMPREEQLPKSMRRLTRRNALSVRPDPDFHRDMDRLIHALQGHEKRKNQQPPEPQKPAPTPNANAWRVVVGVIVLAAISAGAVGLLLSGPKPATAPGASPKRPQPVLTSGSPQPSIPISTDKPTLVAEPARAVAPFDAVQAKQFQKAWADYLNAQVVREVNLGSGATLKLALIPPGTFLMGSPENEAGRAKNEGPQHQVKITEPYYMGVYPVTRAQFAAFVQDAAYQTEAELAGESYIYLAETRQFHMASGLQTGRRRSGGGGVVERRHEALRVVE